MPVQEPEKKKTDIPVTDTEELKKQQSAVYENSFQKSGKLLPFLNAKAEYHMSRLDTVLGKIATQQDKIRKHENKIEQLGAKADRLEDRNNMLKAAFGNVPFVKNMIEANERRIDAIRNEKIPNRTQKLTNCESKINMLSAKRDRIEHKLSRVTALNDAIKSFSIGFNKERREVFSDAMSRLNGATADCLSDKRDNLISQKNELLAKYNDPKTFIGDKLNLQGKINDVNERISALENRITKLSRPETYYAEQTNDQLDASMKLTADKISEMTDSGNLSVPVLAEGVIDSAHKIEGMELSEVAAVADSMRDMPLKNTEIQIEDDLNMIYGIINNGSKSDLNQAREELLDGIKSMQELAGNPFVSKEMHDMAVQDLAKLQEQFSAVDEKISKLETSESEQDVWKQINDEELMAENTFSVEQWLVNMVQDGKAEVTEDGGFKINPDYYKELPRNDRHVESMTEAQALTVMQALTAAGIEFSAAARGEDKVGITVSKKDVVALSDIMQVSVGKTADRYREDNSSSKSAERYQAINPEYYQSLPKDQRSTRAETKDTAKQIMQGLKQTGIPFSAVVRKNDTVAVTVSKDNAQAYKQIEASVKGERAVQLVNPEFFKALPKEERFTQCMTEDQAKARTSELDKNGVSYSAVLNGEKSAVTVAKKDKKIAFFPRSRLKKEVQRLNGHNKTSQQKEQSQQKKNQGLSQ